MKIIRCREVTPSQGQSVIAIQSPLSMLDVYGSGEEVLVFHVEKALKNEDEYWVIGEQLSTVYIGDNFVETLKDAKKDIDIEYSG